MNHHLNSRRVKLAYAVISMLVSLAFVEMLSHQLLPRPGFVPFDVEQLPGLIVQHPTRGYAYSANYSGSTRTEEHEIKIALNSLGLRDDPIEADEDIDRAPAGAAGRL